MIEQHLPQESAIEEVFMGKNAGSALKLGQARGAAMTACLSHDLPVEEYSARKVKQAVVGVGSADKTQVQHMVKALLKISDNIAEDAADALAVAICHANTQTSLIRMAGAKNFSRKRLRGYRLRISDRANSRKTYRKKPTRNLDGGWWHYV